MRYAKWTLIALAVAFVAGFVHWSLPSRDIVRIVDTEIRRSDMTGTVEGREVVRTQDVRFIAAVTPSGSPRVYRNQDTGFGWPPFFKFDSANLAARAQDVISSEDDPRWMIVTHYGWRIPMISAFPNAVSVRPATGPEQTLIPWLNMALLALLAVVAFVLWRRVRRFLHRRRAA
ncbi:MAG: DUF1523 family protein [Pseudomonadota bacterium]